MFIYITPHIDISYKNNAGSETMLGMLSKEQVTQTEIRPKIFEYWFSSTKGHN